MKILHITAMNPLSPNSGVPVVLKALTDEQNQIQGIEARVLSLKSEVTSIGSSFFDVLGEQKLTDYLNEYRPDIAIIHSFYHYEYAMVAKILDKEKIPFIIEPHGSFGKNAIKKSFIKKFIADRTVFRRLIKKAIAYIFTNEAEMQDSVYRTSNDVVIPNGVSENVVKDAAEKNDLIIREPKFYFLGRYDIHHKGLDYLLDALGILDNQKQRVEVDFYGVGNDEQVTYLRERIKEFSFVQAEDKGTIYGAAKKKSLEESNILLLTSRYEGSPMTILDALSYGNPCLVTPGTNVADEIEQNGLGWKVELRAESIAKGILRAREEYVLASKEYASKCKNYVLGRYVWSRIAVLSVEKLKEILQNG